MEDLRTKIGYIRGLAEGYGMDDTSKEGKILSNVVDVLEQMTDQLEELQTKSEELLDYTESIDEDLTDLETDVYGTGEEDEEEEDFLDGFTIECPSCSEAVFLDEDVLDDEEELEVLCPSCGEVVLINDEELDDEDLDLEDEVIEGEDQNYKEE